MRWLIGTLMLSVGTLAMAAEWSAEQDARYQGLIQELRCLVCQNQSIAESNAELAQDLRKQVRQQMEQGRSDDEIRAYLTDRYGEFVLYRPPITAKTVALWVGPFVLLLVGIFIALRILRRPRAAAATAAPDPERLAALLKQERGK
ncbi:MAG: cytochrome c-type biogenesis protein [Panacagrimonas sp.]